MASRPAIFSMKRGKKEIGERRNRRGEKIGKNMGNVGRKEEVKIRGGGIIRIRE